MKATTPSSSSSSPPSSSDWAWLPHTTLLLVLNKLLLLSDKVKFSSVCTNWCYVAKDRLRRLNLQPNMPLYRNLPFLLISSTQGDDSARSLYSINQGEIFDLNLRVPFKRRCCGSSHDWLIVLDGDSFEVNLINPFYFGSSKGIIRLPRFSAAFDMYAVYGQAFRSEYYISKAILSSDPISYANEYVVMIIYGDMGKLAFWKPGAENWTYVNWIFYPFFDVVYVQGRFLAVNIFGAVYSCETNFVDQHQPYKVSTLSVSLMALLGGWTRRYLVELPDRTILQVIRTLQKCMCSINCSIQNTTGFFIYKMPEEGDKVRDWLEVSGLVDGALFLGANYSHYVSASQFPGCRANAIYFTDDCCSHNDMLEKPFGSPFDIGVYLLEERRVERFSSPIHEEYHYPPPIWILPTI